MKFENQYLTYEDYRLLGGKMEYMPFNLLEYEARRIIDGRTQRRLIGIEEIPQEVKMCINKMISCMANYISTMQSDTQSKSEGKSNVASENIDGYSVSYVTADQVLANAQTIIKSKQTELEDIMFDYLIGCVVNGEHIMYNGVN